MVLILMERGNAASFLKIKNNNIMKIHFYIKEAIRIEKSGVKSPKKEHGPLEIPLELEEAFKENERLREAFYKLTPGRQRAYAIEISKAKRSETKRNRIEKYTEKIYQGKVY